MLQVGADSAASGNVASSLAGVEAESQGHAENPRILPIVTLAEDKVAMLTHMKFIEDWNGYVQCGFDCAAKGGQSQGCADMCYAQFGNHPLPSQTEEAGGGGNTVQNKPNDVTMPSKAGHRWSTCPGCLNGKPTY